MKQNKRDALNVWGLFLSGIATSCGAFSMIVANGSAQLQGTTALLLILCIGSATILVGFLGFYINLTLIGE